MNCIAANTTIKFFSHLPKKARQIRTAVFINEQGFSAEFDDIDKRAHHLVIYAEDGTAIGTARLFLSETSSKAYTIGRLSVLKEYRHRHLGGAMLSAMEDKARQLGAEKTELSAQCRARSFYEKNGYTASGEIYLDEYCPHIHMEKNLKK